MDFGPTLTSRLGGLWPSDDYGQDRALCIEFANTVSWRGKPNPVEYLPNPAAWLDWLGSNSALPKTVLENLRTRASLAPDEFAASFEDAIEFREALYNLLFAHSQGHEPSAKDRMPVQDMVARAMSRLRFVSQGGQWGFELCADAPGWEATLYGPALSAAQLLTSDYAPKIRFCERPECHWLFLDLTKNHSRKWCSMQTCGNVVKARANYARKKSRAASTL